MGSEHHRHDRPEKEEDRARGDERTGFILASYLTAEGARSQATVAASVSEPGARAEPPVLTERPGRPGEDVAAVGRRRERDIVGRISAERVQR